MHHDPKTALFFFLREKHGDAQMGSIKVPSTRCYSTNTWPNQANDGSMESPDQELFIDVNFVARDP